MTRQIGQFGRLQVLVSYQAPSVETDVGPMNPATMYAMCAKLAMAWQNTARFPPVYGQGLLRSSGRLITEM